MARALEHVRRMRGGAQPQLLRCAKGLGDAWDPYYVVKFQENPQHRRVLANEWLGTRLASALGLPVPEPAVVEVGSELLAHSEDMAIQLARGKTKLRPGRQFGSRYPGDPMQITVYDFLPDELLAEVENLSDFLGMLVFDKRTCNTNGRQVIFYRPEGQSRFRAVMIDQGFCFNAGEWNFPDAPLRGLYARARVYESVNGPGSFGPWLERLESRVTERKLDEAASEIPPEWYDFDQEALYQLLEQLWRRRSRVSDLIASSKDTYRRPFPHWT